MERYTLEIIGVNKWKDNIRLFAKDMLKAWDLEDTMIMKKKIWDIAREAYRGWHSNLQATYHAYSTDGERLKNKPEDLDIMEWEYLIHYSRNVKTSQAHGHGYMTKPLTPVERLHAQMDQQARVGAEAQQQNVELHGEVEELREKLAAQQAESDRLLEAELNERLQSQEGERNARLQIQEEQRKARELLKELMRMFEGQRAASTQQSAQTMEIPSENAALHAKTKKNQGNGNGSIVHSQIPMGLLVLFLHNSLGKLQKIMDGHGLIR